MIRWLHRLTRRSNIEAEMLAEMEFHRGARTADLIARHGLSPEAAERQARVEFGSVEAYREEARAAYGWRLFDELRGDLRYAARNVRNHPGFTLATVAILAAAIGANAAFFNVYSNHALRPLPIRAPERHYAITAHDSHFAPLRQWNRDEVRQLEAASRNELEGIYSASGLLQVLLFAPTQRQGMATAVSANYFPLLGARPALGRTFNEREEREPVALLSDAGWRRLFPGEASPLGQTIRVRSTAFTIIGVMPPSFTGTEAAVPDFWVGSGMREALREGIGERQRTAAILRQGIQPVQAEAVLTALASRFPRSDNELPSAVQLKLHSTHLGADAEDTLVVALLVFTTFLLVLGIACANLAGLFLARMAARTQEIAMRFSLGASRARIVRQLLTEAGLLGMLGAAAGLATGFVFLNQAQRWIADYASGAGATLVPYVHDWRVFLYSATLGVLATLAFGLFPALRSTSLRPKQPGRLRAVLLAGQVAASLVLLILAGVLVRNLQRLEAMHPGFDLNRSFDLQVEPASPALLTRLRSKPGIVGVTAVQQVPLYGRMPRTHIQIGSATFSTGFNFVDDQYFRTLELQPTRGREFLPFEAANSARVTLVSESTAKRFWPGRNPLGQSVRLLPESDASIAGSYEVIGVVPDVINGWIWESRESAMIYLPGAAGQPRMTSALVRLQDPSLANLASLRELCAAVPNASGCEPKSLHDVAGIQQLPFQIAAYLAALLGLLALILTAVGLYSAVSYSVQQRRREIGVLMAIGAPPQGVVRRIVSGTARPLLAGTAVGLPIALILSALAASSVLRIRTFDPVAYLGVPALLLAVAALACMLPLRRALSIDPSVVLRQD
jgi:macrolide transport system ATP-binding/permease protein